MKKFRITDDEGSVYEVEPIEEKKEVFETGDEDKTNCADEELSDEEIMTLKRLAAIADDLIKLLDVEKKEHAATEPDEEVEETLGDEDEERIDDEDKEEVIDTDEDKKSKKDSRTSFGSLLNSKSRDSSDLIDSATAIEKAWSKRYGGK